MGIAIWAVLLVIVIALCRIAADADCAANNAFAAREKAERQKLHTFRIGNRDHAA